MSRWKLFGKSKEEKEPETTEEAEEKEEVGEPEDKPIAEYRETLETGKATSTKTSVGSGATADQRLWRDVDTIEDDIDTLGNKKSEKPISNLDEKVDKLIEKNKSKLNKKPSNVIYVVSKPQPGEVKGDWAVRSHGKIFSHHKTKEKAIEEARKIAVKREATVMVQNTDGTFSDGFKPRPKK